ncbi:MAG: hypothetical protein R3Y11_00350 [Pseudomonadota bacterium]
MDGVKRQPFCGEIRTVNATTISFRYDATWIEKGYLPFHFLCQYKMTAEEFDSYFDDGGSVLPFAALEKASRPNKVKQVNVGRSLGIPKSVRPEDLNTKRVSNLQWTPTT